MPRSSPRTSPKTYPKTSPRSLHDLSTRPQSHRPNRETPAPPLLAANPLPLATAPKNKRTPELRKSLRSQVLALRTQFPAWGRKPLCTVLKREKGIQTSESTVGRLLKKLIAQGKVKPVSFYRGILKKRRPRTFHGHARAWHKKLKSKAPGEMIQMSY